MRFTGQLQLAVRWGVLVFVVIAIVCGGLKRLSDNQTLPPEDQLSLIFPTRSFAEAQASQRYLDDFLIHHPKRSFEKTWARWIMAALWREHDKKLSCEHYKYLLDIPDHPIHDLAYLRAWETCGPGALHQSRLFDLALRGDTKWLRLAAIELALQEAEKTQNQSLKAELLLEKSRWVLTGGEKVGLVQEAIQLSKKIGDDALKIAGLERLYRIAPRFKLKPPQEDWLNVAKDFQKAREFSKAQKYYRDVAKLKRQPTTVTLDALRGLRMSYKLQQDRPHYVSATEEIARFSERLWVANKKNPESVQNHLEGQVTLARTLWTEQRLDEARKLLLKAQKQLASADGVDEVYWLLARMAEEKGLLNDAKTWNDKAMNASQPSSTIWESIQWQQAWNSRKRGDFETALRTLQRLKANRPDSNSRYIYWTGRTLLQMERTGEATQEFLALIAKDPLSFYSIIAHRELRKPFEPLKLSYRLNREMPAAFEPADAERMRWLMLVGERGVAKDLLRSMMEQVRANPPSLDDQRRLAFLFAAVNDYSTLFELINSWHTDERNVLLDLCPELVFPRPHYTAVRQAAEQWNLPSELIYSIMRQESAFNALARSPADAFGLMQLTPETARSIASIGRLPFQQPEDLYDPAINIPLGAAQLRHALKRFDDQMILAVASYNASEQAVQGWVNTRFHGDPTEFIEDIPYAETQTYVKLVLRNFVFYQRLNSKGARVSFPEWALGGLERATR